MDTLAQRLTSLVLSVEQGVQLNEIRILIATWHQFRELTKWQTEVLGLLRGLSARVHTQVRTRSLDKKLRASLQELDLASRLRETNAKCAPKDFAECFDEAESDMDWEWEGGVLI
jgi:DNA-binding transcriptional MerR regulator